MTNTGVALGATTKSATIDYEGFNYIHANAGNDHPLVLLLDGDGKPLCSSSSIAVEGTANIVDIRSYNGSLYCLSGFMGQFGSDGLTSTSVGTRDLVVWKTCLPCDTLTSIPEATAAQPALLIYPNPSNTQTQLSYRSPQGTRPTLQLRDMLGRTVQTLQLAGHEGSYTLNAAGLGTGVYFCSLVSGAEVLATEKLVVQR